MSRILEAIYCWDGVDGIVQSSASLNAEQRANLTAAQDYLGLELYDSKKGFVNSTGLDGGITADYNLKAYRHSVDENGNHVYSVNCLRPSTRGVTLRGTSEMQHYLLSSEPLSCRAYEAFQGGPLQGRQDFPVEHGDLDNLPEVQEGSFQSSPLDQDAFLDDIDNMIALTATYEKAKSNGKAMLVYYVPEDYAKFVKTLGLWLSFLSPEEEKDLTFATLLSSPRFGYKIIGIPTSDIDSIDLADLGEYEGLKYPADEFEWRDGKQGGPLVALLRRASNSPEIFQEFQTNMERLGKKSGGLEEMGNLAGTLLLLDCDFEGIDQLDIGRKGRREKEYLSSILSNIKVINSVFKRFPRQAIEFLKAIHVSKDGNYAKLMPELRTEIFQSLWKLYRSVHDDRAKLEIQALLHDMVSCSSETLKDEADLNARASLMMQGLVNPETKTFFEELEEDYLLDDSDEFKAFIAFAKKWLSEHGNQGDALVDYCGKLCDRLFSSMASEDDQQRLFDLLDTAKLAKSTWTRTVETIFERNSMSDAERFDFFMKYLSSLNTKEERKDLVDEAVHYLQTHGKIPFIVASLATQVFFGGAEDEKREILDAAFAIYLELPSRKVTTYPELVRSLNRIRALEADESAKSALTKNFATEYLLDFDPHIVQQIELKVYTTEGRAVFEELCRVLKEASNYEKAQDIQEQIDLREPEIQRHEEAVKNESEIYEFRMESVLTTFRSLSIDRMKEVVLHFIDRNAFKAALKKHVDDSYRGDAAPIPEKPDSKLDINEGEKKVPVANVNYHAKNRGKDKNYAEMAAIDFAERILSPEGEVPWNDAVKAKAQDRFAIRSDFANITLAKKEEERAALAALRNVGKRIGFSFLHASITAILIIAGSIVSRAQITAGAYYAFYAGFTIAGFGFMWLLAFLNYKTYWGRKMRLLTLMEDFIIAALLIGVFILFFRFVF